MHRSHTPRGWVRGFLFVSALAAGLGAVPAARAQTNFWWTNGVNGAWAEGFRWTNNAGLGGPVDGGSNDYILTFLPNATYTTTNNLAAANFFLNQLVFNAAGNTVTNFGAIGKSLVFTNNTAGDGPRIFLNSAAVINHDLTLGTTLTITNVSGKVLTLSAIASNVIRGAGGLVFDAPAAASLSTAYDTIVRGTNTYSGGTTINRGRVRTDNGNPFIFGTGNVTINDGGQFLFAGGTAATAMNNAFTIAGRGVLDAWGYGGALRIEGSNTISGPIVLSADARIGIGNSNQVGKVNGVISGAFALEVFGASANAGEQMQLNAANTYSGGTTIEGITLRVGNAQALGLPAADKPLARVLMGGQLDVNGFTIRGLRPLELSGFGVSPTSGALINGSGTGVNVTNITLIGSAAIGQTGGGRIDAWGTADGGGFYLSKVGASEFVFRAGATNFAGIFINGGVVRAESTTHMAAIPVQVNAGATYSVWARAVTNPVILNGGAIDYGNTGGATTNMGSVTLLASTNTFTTGALLIQGGVVSGPGGLRKVGNGLLELTNANTYAGLTFVDAGTIQFSRAEALPAAGSIAINVGGALAVTGAYDTVAGWLGDGRILTSSMGALALRANNSELVDLSSYANLSIGSLTGTTNTYSGTVTPGANGYFLGGGGGTLVFDSTLVGAGTTSTFGRGGGGVVILAQNNTASGPATIWAGTLQLGTGGTAGWIDAPSIANSGTLSVVRSDTVYLPTMSGSGALSMGGNGILMVTNVNTHYGANTVVSNGTLWVTGNGRLGAFNPVTGANPGDFNIGNTAARSATGVVDSAKAGILANILRVGNTGNGVLQVTNGSVETRSWFILGQNDNTTGRVDMVGGSLLVNAAGGGNLQVGVRSGLATLNIDGDARVVVTNGGGLWLGSDTTSASGTVNQGGSSFVQVLGGTGVVLIGRTGSGVYNLNGGVLLATNVAGGTGGRRDLNLNGGTLRAAGPNAAFVTNLTAMTLQGGGGTIDSSNFTVTVRQNLSGSGLLTKAGTGTLVLDGTNSNTGGILVDEGRVLYTRGDALGTGGADLVAGDDGSIAFGYAGLQTLLATRVGAASSGTIALMPVQANENVDFNAAGLTGAFLGAASNLTYGGTFTPNGTTYRLGGGGAVLTYTNAIGSGSNLVIGGGSGGGTPSVVVLTAANSADSTTLEANALRATDGVGLSSGNLAIDGGVLETSGTFNRGLGTGASQVQFVGSGGGFSAFGAPLSVDIGGAGDALAWGSANFAPGAEMTLNAASANAAITLVNPIDLNGNSAAIRVDSTAAGAVATAAGSIHGLGNLAKRGAGVLVVSAAGLYSGSTTVEQGILRLSGGADRLPAGTGLTLANVAGAALDLNGQNQTVASLAGGGSVGGNVNLGAGTLAVNQAANTTFGGILYGAGGLTKQGSGTLTLTNASVYTGLTAIEGGTLQLAAAGANQAGLSEGWLNATVAWLPPMPRSNTVLSARFNSTYWGNSSGPTPIWPAVWPANTTIGYQGYVYNNSGSNVTWTFALVCDDNSRLVIDGVQVVLQAGTAWATNSIVLTPGAHAIDYRISNGGGGAGGGGTSNYQLLGGGYGHLGGFAYDPLGRSSINGSFYQALVDPGNGSLFTTGLNLLPAASLVSISPNAVLDLNGAAQIVGGLTDPLAAPGSGGTVTNTAATPALLALAPAAGTVRTFTGGIADDGTAGRSITVVANGPGVQVLAGTNAYGGGTFVQNGTLRLASTSALPASSSVALSGGAVAFDWAGAQNMLTTRVVAGSSGALALTASNAAENVNFNLPGYAGMFLGAADDVAYFHTLTPAGAPNLFSAVQTNLYRLGGGGGTLTFSNSLVDAFSLTVGSGAGRVVLTTDNSLPGALTVNNGAVLDLGGHSQTASSAVVLGVLTNSSATMATLSAGMNGIFSVNVTNANNWINTGSIGGAINLTKVGPGVQTLAAANSHTGTNTVNGGTLALGFSIAGPSLGQTNNLLPAGATLRLGGGVLQVLGARAMTNSQALGTLTIDAGASAINMAPAAIVGGVNLSLGEISRNAHGAMNFTVSSTGIVTATGAPLVNGILPYATVNLNDWATTNAAGQIVANTTYVNDTWAAGNNTTVAGSTAVNGGTTYSLRFADATARTLTLSGLNTIQGGGILFANPANDGSTIGGTGWVTSATGELLVIDNDTSKDRKNGNSSVISAVIADNGGMPVSLTVASMVPNALDQMSRSSAANSEVSLTGTNLYSGGTYLAGGAIAIATDRNLGAYPVAEDPDNITVLSGYNAIRGSLAAVTSGVNRGISLQNNSVLMLSANGGAANTLRIEGVISGSGYVVSPPGQDGTVILTGSNTFSGVLEVEGNVRAIDGVGLSTNANLKLGDTGQRGMLETTGTFTRALGAGPGQVQWSANNAYIGAYNNGGFAAVGGPLTVNIGGQANALTWNTNSLAMGQFAFGQLCLQDGNSTDPLTWLNPIDFAGGSRVIANNQALNGNAPTILAGALYNGGLSKGWGGLLWLTATNNLGAIGISGGAVRGEFGVGLGNSAITLNGGILETSGLLTNSLGSQARQIQITAPGASGFSAYGAPLILNLDNGAPLVWQANSYFNPSIFSLQEVTANASLTLLNGIDLTGSNRFFQVNGTNASIAPVIAGVISGSGMAGQSALTKQGVGMLVLAATNTYDGPTFLNAGTLSVGYLADGGLGSGIGASPANLTNLVFAGGRLLYTGLDATSDRGFQIGANGGWINVASNTLTLGGTFSNSAANAFTKIGNGTLRLTGDGRLVNGVNAYGGSLVFTGTNTFGAMNVETNGNLTFGENSFSRAGVITVKTGALLLTNGTVFVGNNAAHIGNAAGDFGTMTLAGTAVWSSTNMPDNVAGPILYVGNAGKGVLIVDDNAILTNRLYIGNTATGSGAIYQRGGTVINWDGRASDGRIGMTGYGYYELSGGTLTNLGYTQLGRDPTGIGVQAQYGGTFLQGTAFQGSLQLSRSGVGVYHMAGGTFASAATIDLGNLSDNTGSNGVAVFTMAGGTATIAGNVNMADRTNMYAVLNMNGGVLTANQISKANRPGSMALVNFDGGTLQARAGGHLINIGVNAPTAAYIHDGGATIDSQSFIVTNMQALLAAPGQGVSGIAMTPMGGFIGSPYVEITGGGGTGATAFAQFDSYSGSVTGIVVTSPGYNYTTAPVVTLRGGGSTNVTLASGIAGNTSGGLTKIGNGTLMLGASNTYAGTTRIMAGVLGLTGAGAVRESATIQIDAGAKMVVTGLTASTMHLVSGQTLQGNGTFQGGLITDSGSAVRPGSSAGTLTVLGNLTADAGSTFTFELDGLAAGTQYDQILFGGAGAHTLALNDATLDVQLNFVPGLGDSFQIISGFGTLAGTPGEFSGRPDGSTFTVNSTEFQIDYNASDITLTVVPEPASLGLLSLLGLAGWLMRRRPRD